MATKPTTAQLFVTAARGCLGVPFRYQGRAEDGIDCVGVVLLSLEAVGVTIEVLPYGKTVSSEHVLQQLRGHGRRVPFSEARPGDIAVLNYRGQSNHIGIITGDGTMIHSLAFARRVVEQPLTHPDVRPYWVGLYRLNALEKS